jgi:hypothetical protein
LNNVNAGWTWNSRSGSGLPRYTAVSPSVTSDRAMIPSLFASLYVYGRCHQPPAGYPLRCCWRALFRLIGAMPAPELDELVVVHAAA